MKKLLAGTALVIVCLFVTITTVSAALRWYIGEQFNAKGKVVSKEISRTGNFYNGVQLLEKYSEGDMTIKLEGFKKGFLGIGWSSLGSQNINASGVGALNNRIVDKSYPNSGTNTVKVQWEQTTTGHLAAHLRY